MDVLIYLHNVEQPIQATIPNFDANEFANQLNQNLLFVSIGGNVLSRNLIKMITPVSV